MATFKRLSVFMAVSSLLGVVCVTAITPGLVGWYNAPGAGGAMCNCSEMARNTAVTIVTAQVTGLVVGALLGLGLGLFFVARQRKAHALAAPALAAPVDNKPS
jgi:hypothetical protein